MFRLRILSFYYYLKNINHSIRKKTGKYPVTRFLVMPLPVTPLRVLLTTHMTYRFHLCLQIIPGLNKCIISCPARYWKAFILKNTINIPSGFSILFEKRYGFLRRRQLFSCFTDFPDQQTHKQDGVLLSLFIISVAIKS